VTATGSTTAFDPRTVERIRALVDAFEQATGFAMPLRLPGGVLLGPVDAPYRVAINQPWALWALARPPYDLRAGEAYVEGALDLEGDIIAMLADVARFSGTPSSRRTMLAVGRRLLALPRPPRRSHPRRAALRGRKHSKARDRAAISFHYDLPDEFYRQFLDSRMVYSCAYFADQGVEPGPPPVGAPVPGDLDLAQERKLDLICRKLRLEPGQRLLDIGCGWGSLLLHAAERYGVGGLGVTLSTTQKEAADRRISEAGLTGKVEVQLLDYRDLEGEFDAVASVGMFEHVGPENLPEYFAAAHRLTRNGGLFLNHGITLGDPDRVGGQDSTFVSTYVFPDGGLAPAWRAARELERAGFELLDVEQLRPNYALTLRHWVRNLEANRDAVASAASEADYRIWRTYMAGSAVSFEQGSIGVVQVLGSKGHQPPLGRAWMLAS
jgi:cyclopropane-fatty-acyl-phospholipid synthase